MPASAPSRWQHYVQPERSLSCGELWARVAGISRRIWIGWLGHVGAKGSTHVKFIAEAPLGSFFLLAEVIWSEQFYRGIRKTWTADNGQLIASPITNLDYASDLGYFQLLIRFCLSFWPLLRLCTTPHLWRIWFSMLNLLKSRMEELLWCNPLSIVHEHPYFIGPFATWPAHYQLLGQHTDKFGHGSAILMLNTK